MIYNENVTQILRSTAYLILTLENQNAIISKNPIKFFHAVNIKLMQ